jgi:hypothetical protein
MNHHFERRAAHHDSDEALSPEILALLVTCGGEIRESDRSALAEGRWRGGSYPVAADSLHSRPLHTTPTDAPSPHAPADGHLEPDPVAPNIDEPPGRNGAQPVREPGAPPQPEHA